MNFGKYRTLVLLISFCFVNIIYAQKSQNSLEQKIAVNFNGDAQVEVGNAYVGVELHHSSILPERISFYYPVANSIDLSTDYFHRDTTYIMKLGLKVGNGPKEWLGKESYDLNLTPYRAILKKKSGNKSIKVTYQFSKNDPAMIVTYEITNLGKKKQNFEFYTHLETSLHTSHTYALKDKAETVFDKNTSCVFADFNDEETQYARVFVANAAEKPISFNTVGNLNSAIGQKDNYWFTHNGKLPEKIFTKENEGIPAAEFLYKKNLAPNQKMVIVQIIGSSKKDEGEKIVNHLIKNYKSSVLDYENYVLNYVNDGNFNSGDKVIDQSYLWSKAILAVNKHYIDGEIRPMPCPAEYNFYFTHDVLVTDYAAVNFNLNRVKNDLNFIINHANSDYIIPHAYYWKDSSYKTEYASSDNWNNFWFVIVAGSYLRHSADTKFLSKIYPYVSKCIEQTLKNKKADDLMWEAHLDGSDLGDSYGQRAFMTSLSIKALRDFVYISSVLGKNESVLIHYQNLASDMQKQLNSKLWSEKQKYLINYYAGGKIDTHYYTGSLIAPHFNVLNSRRIDELVNSATSYLLDPKIGIYSIYPMDLNKLKSFLKLKGDEAGKPYYYANGGVWMHANAWFALSLIADGKNNEAYNFIRKLMTLNGIINSPNGQPAMYEYRISDPNNPEVYGKIDKPQFLWAAGWYIYSIYHLYGIKENTWNIQLNPYLSENQKSCSFSLTANGKVFNVSISGKGKLVKDINFDGKLYPSLVIPSGIKTIKDIKIELGNPVEPYVLETDSKLEMANYDNKNKEMNIVLSAFKKHRNSTTLISPQKPKQIMVDGKTILDDYTVTKENAIYKTVIEKSHSSKNMKIKVIF